MAEARESTPAQLARLLRGDLDWITLKALEKDRLRRYASASEFASDLERYVQNEPVSAGPPSTFYRVKKFVARTRIPVLAGAVVLAILILGIVVSTSAMLETRRERDRAIVAEQLAARQVSETEAAREELRVERDRALEAESLAESRLVHVEHSSRAAEQSREPAEQEAAQSAAVTEFLKTMWAFAKPQGGESQEVTALQLLAEASNKLDASMQNEPEVQVSLHSTLGAIYIDLARYREAERELRAALLIGRTQTDNRSANFATLLHNLAVVHSIQAKWAEARPLIDESLEIRVELFGEDHIELAASYDLLARYHSHLGEFGEAVVAARRALAITEREHGALDKSAITLKHNLAYFLRDNGELEQARVLLEEIVELRVRELGPENPDTLTALSSLAHVWHAMGEHEEAADSYGRILSAREAMFGADALQSAQSRNDLATQFILLERFEEAIPMLRQALRTFERELSESHPSTIAGTNNLARALADNGLDAEALES